MAEGKQMLDDALRRLRWRVDVLEVLDYRLCEHFNISDDRFWPETYQNGGILESTAVHDVICEAFHKLRLEEVWQYAPDRLLDLVDQQSQGECENLTIVTDVRNRIEFMRQKDNEELENGVLDMYRPIAQTVEKLVRETHTYERFRTRAIRYADMWPDYEERWRTWLTHRDAALKNPELQNHSKRPPGDDLVFIVIRSATTANEEVRAWVPPRPQPPLPEYMHDELDRDAVFRADHWLDRDDMLSVQYGKLAVVHDYVLLPDVASILPPEARNASCFQITGLGFSVDRVIRESCQSYELSLLESDLEAVEADLRTCKRAAETHTQDVANATDDGEGEPGVQRVRDRVEQAEGALPLKEWLWRVRCLEEELARLVPASDVHIAFTIQESCISSSREFNTFPFGEVLFDVGWPLLGHRDETGALWFSWENMGLPFTIRWDEEGWSVQTALPPANSTDRPMLSWRTWYYIKKTSNTNPAAGGGDQERWLELSRWEESVLECCDMAPKSVHDTFGQLTCLGNWPTVIFYLAMTRTHPLLQADGHPLRWPYGPNCGKGEWVDDGHGGRSWQEEPPASEPNTWHECNDYAILLHPDLRTATSHAFEVLRRIATAESPTAEAAQAALNQASASDGTVVSKAKTDGNGSNDDDLLDVTLKHGLGTKEFMTSEKTIKALKLASKNPGTWHRINKSTFEKMKRTFKDRLGDDGELIASSLEYKDGRMRMKSDSNIRLIFEGFGKQK